MGLQWLAKGSVNEAKCGLVLGKSRDDLRSVLRPDGHRLRIRVEVLIEAHFDRLSRTRLEGMGRLLQLHVRGRWLASGAHLGRV